MEKLYGVAKPFGGNAHSVKPLCVERMIQAVAQSFQLVEARKNYLAPGAPEAQWARRTTGARRVLLHVGYRRLLEARDIFFMQLGERVFRQPRFQSFARTFAPTATLIYYPLYPIGYARCYRRLQFSQSLNCHIFIAHATERVGQRFQPLARNDISSHVLRDVAQGATKSARGHAHVVHTLYVSKVERAFAHRAHLV